MREAWITEQPRALGAQRDHLGNDRLVVGCAAAIAARDPGAKRLLAQVAPGGELQERLDARARGGDEVLARKPTLLGRRTRRRAHKIGKAGKVLLAIEKERVALLVRQNVLAKGGAERGEPRVDVREPRLGHGVERGTCTHELEVIALENAPLFRRQRQLIACAVQALDTAEQGRVHVDAVPVLCLEGGDLALDGEDLVVVVGARQEVEDVDGPAERIATFLERGDGVGEARRGRVVCDSRDLARMRGKSVGERGPEMFRPDPVEGGDAEWTAPFLEQWVGVLGDNGLALRMHATSYGA